MHPSHCWPLTSTTIRRLSRSNFAASEKGLALLELAVGHHHPDLAGVAASLTGQGDAAGLAERLGERAGRRLDAGRVLGADHLDRAAVLVELLETVLGEPSDLDQRRVEHEGVVGGREDEPVVLRRLRSVVGAAVEEVRVVRPGHAGERLGDHRRGARPQVEDPRVEHGEDLGGRQGLAHVAAVVAENVIENANTDPVGDGLSLDSPVVLRVG